MLDHRLLAAPAQSDAVTVQNPIRSVTITNYFEEEATVKAGTFPVRVRVATPVEVTLKDAFDSPVSGLGLTNFKVFVLQDARDTLSSIADRCALTQSWTFVADSSCCPVNTPFTHLFSSR